MQPEPTIRKNARNWAPARPANVEMEVEGPEEAIDQLFQLLDNDRYIIIENFSCKEIPVEGESTFFYKD